MTFSDKDLLKFIYLEQLARHGRSSGHFSFSSGIREDDTPGEIAVFYWRQDNSTFFSTLGMCTFPMIDDQRVELQLKVKGRCGNDETMAFCRFLANFAIYPYLHEISVDWWHMIMDVGPVPVFPDSESILIHPGYSMESSSKVKVGDETVKLLTLAPLTSGEADIVVSDGVISLLDYFEENEIDMMEIR